MDVGNCGGPSVEDTDRLAVGDEGKRATEDDA